MYVCLTTLGKKKKNMSLDGISKYKKCRLSYFYNWLYLCILYQWNFFILEIKGYNKKNLRQKNLSGLVVWPDPDWSPSLISSWHRRKLAFDIRFSRRSLALFLSLLLFPHLSVSFYFSLLLSPSYIHFPKNQRVVESQILVFLAFFFPKNSS